MGAAASILKRGMTEAVIGGALLIVLQDVIGFVDFLEFDFGGVIAGIAVGVQLHRHLAIGGFQLGRAGAFFAAQSFVVTTLHRPTRKNIRPLRFPEEGGSLHFNMPCKSWLAPSPGLYAAPFFSSSSTSENSASTTLSDA